jgi:TetR/AcrR family transcriptional regulator, cholesterol catabolism regulator
MRYLATGGITMVDERRAAALKAGAPKPTRILEAAARLFDVNGYHATSMDAIAEAAQVAKPTLYYYFSGKDYILWAIHDEIIEELIAKLEARTRTSEDAAWLLGEVVRDLLEFCVRKPGHVRVYLDHYRSLPEEYRGKATERRYVYERMVENVVRDGMAKGIFRQLDPHIVALAIFGACRTFNWSHDWSRSEASPDAQAIVAVLNDLFGNGLRAPGIDTEPTSQ